jgi:hypothetical protein
MSYVEPIIDAFGGVRPMARALGKPASTVQSWKDRGRINDGNKWEILAVANSLGLGLGPADFFPKAPSQSDSDARGAA